MTKDLKNALADLSVVSADAVSGVLTLGIVPAGSLVKASVEVYSAYRIGHLEQKLNKFLETIQSGDTTREEIEEFLEGLEDKKEYVSDYLQGLLINAETAEKTKLFAYIYKAAVKKEIDHDTMLKLCSIVNNSYIFDLKLLPDYCESNEDLIEEANPLINLGLINNYIGGCGQIIKVWS